VIEGTTNVEDISIEDENNKRPDTADDRSDENSTVSRSSQPAEWRSKDWP